MDRLNDERGPQTKPKVLHRDRLWRYRGEITGEWFTCTREETIPQASVTLPGEQLTDPEESIDPQDDPPFPGDEEESPTLPGDRAALAGTGTCQAVRNPNALRGAGGLPGDLGTTL